MGSIPDVNFVEGMEQMPGGESIGEILDELKPQVSESDDQSNEKDHESYSMVREKQGKPSAVLSPATKAAEKAKEKSKGKKKDASKLKPPLSSGLGPAETTTRSSLAKRSSMTSPEGALILKSMRINQRTGVPKTTEAEKAKIKELLAKIRKGKASGREGIREFKGRRKSREAYIEENI